MRHPRVLRRSWRWTGLGLTSMLLLLALSGWIINRTWRSGSPPSEAAAQGISNQPTDRPAGRETVPRPPLVQPSPAVPVSDRPVPSEEPWNGITRNISVQVVRKWFDPAAGERAHVRLNVRRDLDLTATVFSRNNQALVTLSDGPKTPGIYDLYWSGRTADHTLLPTEYYWIEINEDGQTGRIAIKLAAPGEVYVDDD